MLNPKDLINILGLIPKYLKMVPQHFTLKNLRRVTHALTDSDIEAYGLSDSFIDPKSDDAMRFIARVRGNKMLGRALKKARNKDITILVAPGEKASSRAVVIDPAKTDDDIIALIQRAIQHRDNDD